MIRTGMMLLALCVLLSARAGAQSTAIGLRAGTTGIGIEIGFPITIQAQLRAGLSTLPLTFEREFGDMNYDVELPPLLPSLTLELVLEERRGVRLGAGGVFLPRSTQLESTPAGTVDVGEGSWPASSVGVLDGSLSHGGVVPYLFAGIGHPIAPRMGFYLDAGAMFLSEPRFSYTYTGPLQFNDTFLFDLENERQQVERDARDLARVLPLVTVGFRVLVL